MGNGRDRSRRKGDDTGDWEWIKRLDRYDELTPQVKERLMRYASTLRKRVWFIEKLLRKPTREFKTERRKEYEGTVSPH